MLTTPKLKELRRPMLIHKLPLLPATAHQTSRNSAERPSKRYAVCGRSLPCLYNCMGHTLYAFYSSLEDAKTLKQASFWSS